MDDVRKLFKKFVSGSQIFKNKDVLSVSYVPTKVLHREDVIKEIVSNLASILKGRTPQNLFIYGLPGTGKTVVVKLIGNALVKEAEELKIPVDFVYISAGEGVNTPYKLFAKLSTYFGNPVPHTGLSTSTVVKSFFDAVDSEKRFVVVALDEIDKFSSLNFILYTLSRANSTLKNARISLICISNSFNVLTHLDARTKSSLSPIEINFKPYNADEIRNILKERVKEAFEEGVIDEDVISLCAAYSAKMHGDLRRALNILRFAGEIAEMEGSQKITKEHIKKAQEKLEERNVIDVIRSLPIHSKILLRCVMENDGNVSYTGEIYSMYKELCGKERLKPLTLRRINDLLNELEELGLISCTIISRGRYGRTRVITPLVDSDIKEKVFPLLEEGL